MRALGWVLAVMLVLPFAKAAAQLAVFAAIGLTLLFALKNPRETLGCVATVALLSIGHRYPLIAAALFAGLIVVGLAGEK